MSKEIMEFKEGDIVKVIKAMVNNWKGIKKDNLFMVHSMRRYGVCNYCHKSSCLQVTIKDNYDRIICACCERRLIKATDREAFLFYIYGQSGLKEDQ